MTASNDTPRTAAPAAAEIACTACGASVIASAKFCQNCGAAVGASTGLAADDEYVYDPASPLVTASRGPAAKLPWVLALAGLVGGSAYVASSEPAPVSMADERAMVAPFVQGGGADAAGAAGGRPDIASMTPSERANRLYGRIMRFVEEGKADSAAFFAPMALAAHEMLETATIDERYHYGQVGEMIGNAALARAQADTILAAEPDNLLGLMLASRAARMENKRAEAKPFDTRLLSVVTKELASNRQEYAMHRAEIDRAVADAKRN